jgi:hypothetical protein
MSSTSAKLYGRYGRYLLEKLARHRAMISKTVRGDAEFEERKNAFHFPCSSSCIVRGTQ